MYHRSLVLKGGISIRIKLYQPLHWEKLGGGINKYVVYHCYHVYQ